MTEEDRVARAQDPRGSAETKLVFDVDDNLQNTLKSQKDWAGIVGFFHPFWYVMVGVIMGPG
jgi:alpha-1,2-mannosyltransferase